MVIGTPVGIGSEICDITARTAANIPTSTISLVVNFLSAAGLFAYD
jgi:hypothetical protein